MTEVPQLANAIIAAISGLAGAALGGYLTSRNYDKERLEARRERVHDAYCSWLAASEELSKHDDRTLSSLQMAATGPTDDPTKLDESLRAQWKEHTNAQAKEAAAFYRLALTDPSQQRLARVDTIRQMAPFQAAMATSSGDKYEVFIEHWKRQSEQIATIVKELSEQLKMHGL